jgi:hypothetical protein
MTPDPAPDPAPVHHVVSVTCPYCQHAMTYTTSIVGKDEPPEDGDWVLCIRCGGVCMFDAGALRIPTPAETSELEGQPGVRRLIGNAQDIIRSRTP